jgi:hypothetical protein
MADQLFPQFDDAYEDDDDVEVESTDSDDEEQDAAAIDDEDAVVMEVRTPSFDFDTGDFVVSKSGKMKEAEPDQAWSQWCMKCVATQRYSLLAYGQNYGVDEEGAMAEPDTESKLNYLGEEITDALMSDPNNRTADVGDIEWGRSPSAPDSVIGKVSVENADQTTIGLVVTETDAETSGGE